MRYRVLVLIVAYNAEKTIEQVLVRIPHSLEQDYDIEVLVIDDSSKDKTFERSEVMRRSQSLPFPLHVLFNSVNQGYGGNQKIGFQYAIEKDFDFVALVHGDGQYAPECLPKLLRPLACAEADAVLGSRMMTAGGALEGGMPLYKYAGNRILTWIQNHLLRSNLSEFHSGYRVYAVRALASIPYDLNTNVFHFDTEIIIQLLLAGMRIRELPIPTYYGDEICNVNGLKYAWDVFVTTLKAHMQEYSLFYDRKYDCAARVDANRHYLPKLDFPSPSSLALERMESVACVLELGCGGGYLAHELSCRGASVTAVDNVPPAPAVNVGQFVEHDLNQPLPFGMEKFDYILALDVIEHLQSPERFVDNLRRSLTYTPHAKVMVSTGNVGFFILRLMLLLGQFNYGKRGILDLTHTRLFTIKSFQRLFTQGGFDVLETQGIPAPFAVALGEGVLTRVLLKVNQALIRLSASLFAYQIFLIVRPRPSLSILLRDSVSCSATRAAQIVEPGSAT